VIVMMIIRVRAIHLLDYGGMSAAASTDCQSHRENEEKSCDTCLSSHPSFPHFSAVFAAELDAVPG
jgi:hypothetical protein